MPYAIVPSIPKPVDNHPFSKRTWVGFDVEAGWNGVCLSKTRALVWHPTVTLTDPRAIVLADDALDVVSPARRSLVASLHPDRTFGAGIRLKDLVADLLMRPTPGGSPALRPHREGRFEILCGPGPLGQNRMWEQVTEPDGPHSQDIQDSFNRANGNVDGSTASDGQFTWSLQQGTGSTIQIASNQCKTTCNGGNLDNTLVPSRAMDTINHYVQANFIGKYIGATGHFITHEIWVRTRFGSGAAGEEAYGFAVGGDAVPVGYRAVWAWDVGDLPGASDTTNTTSGVMYLEFNGSTYTAKLDGSTLFSGTDTTWATYKNTALFHHIGGTSTSLFVTGDDFRAADLVAGAVIPVFMNQYRQRGN